MKSPTSPSAPASPSSIRSSVAALTAVIMAQGLSSAARADNAADLNKAKSDSPEKLDAVVVHDSKAPALSTPKFTEPLRDTPQTVVVIPQAVYSQQGATNLSEVLRNTPGITFAAGEGGGASATAGDAFYLRGFDASNNIFIDGVRDVGAYSRDVFNLEQVEVAKGPTGADVGRGASSGYINLASKAPRAEDFVSGSLAFGYDDAASHHRERATLDVNQSLPQSPIKGTAARLNLMWQDGGAIGRETAENSGWAVAPSLALGLGTPTRATFSYQHVEQDNTPDYGLPGAAYPGNFFTPAPPVIDRTTFYGFTADYDRVTSDAYTARLEHDFSPDLRLSQQLRFSANERDAIVTTPGTSPTSYAPATALLTRSRQGNKRNTDILSHHTALIARVATGKVRHDISAGLELARERAYSPAFTNPTLTPVLVALPDPYSVPSASPTRSGAYTQAEVETAALYVFDTLKLGERWQLNGGVRAERYDISYLSVAAGTAAATRIGSDRNLVTWKTGLLFKPVTAGTLYAAYGVSRRPPGSDFTLSSALGNQNNPDTTPQKTTNLELGVKWELLRGRLIATAAGFKTENDKTVFTDPVLGPIPAGRQTVNGIELSASGTITDRWLVFAGFAYLDTEINAGTAVQLGTALPLVPRISGNLWTTYRFASGLTLGGGAQYSGEANRLQTSTAAPVAMPGYWLFNAVASYDFTSRLGLRFNVNNVFGEEYVQSYNNNGGRFMPGAPRNYLLTANLKF